MVVNTSGSTFNYSNSCGTANTVANNRVDIWVGSTLLVNDQTMANAGQAFQDIKFFYNAGSTNGASPIQPSITLSGLNIQTASPATTSLSGVVNQYAQVTAVDAANRRMTLATGSCFNVGDYVIIMQMKGATIDVSNTVTYGNINNYNAAGRYEINQIVGLVAGTTYTFSQSFQFPYDATKNLQVIKMARVVGNATIDGTVTPQAWNGTTGGVVAIWATGTLTFNADINVSGMGFRGGARSNDFAGSTIGVDCSEGSFVQNSANWGEKGEGIVMPADATTGTYARGKLANGGGGGNPHNSGGGGGSNFGSGANGGRQWNCIGGDAENGCNVGSQNGNPTATALNNGVGGVNLNYTVDATNTIRLFMGGGGGGG
jgi:hypothetical protein